MSFDLTRLNRYQVEDANMDYIAGGVVNSYAPVVSISTDSITIDRAKIIEGAHLQFDVGAEIFIHVSASKDGSKAYLGCWAFAGITAVTDNTLTIDKDITADIPARILTNYHIQAITVPFFNDISDKNPIQNNLVPPAFDVDKMCGGIIVIKAVRLFMGTPSLPDYGISLRDRGIPVTHKHLRPWFAYESSGMLDTNYYAGWENAMLEHRLPLNAGDGAALIYTAATSGSYGHIEWLGNSVAKGVRFCRGAADSPNLPEGVTNIGGSTALVISRGRTTDFGLSLTKKYRSTASEQGQGLGARMIVTKNIAGMNCNDGGLYAHMRTHHGLPTNLKIANVFGNGSSGSISDETVARKQMNNYALVTTTSTKATFKTKKVAYSRKTTAGLAPIQTGALVLIQIFSTINWTTLDTVLCNVLDDSNAVLTLDKAVNLGANRQAMIVSIPQFKNFTLTGTNSAIPKYNDGIGGIFAIACSGTCDLSAGKIRSVGKGGVPIKTSDPALVERYERLTLGQGGGSIFILAKKLILSTDTRLGMTNSSNHGGKLGGRGIDGTVTDGVLSRTLNARGGGYRGNVVEDSSNTGGYGGAGGSGRHSGGFFSGGTFDADIINNNDYGAQGSHLMIIADTITGFNINAISTGGLGWGTNGYHGGAGYGGGGGGNGSGGGFRGGGAGDFASGGSAGYAFIYCNNQIDPVTAGIILDE